MKITSANAAASFVPKTLSVTFETQEELDRWTSLFNIGYLSTSEIGVEGPGVPVFRELGRLGGKTIYYSAIRAKLCDKSSATLLPGYLIAGQSVALQHASELVASL